MRITCGVGRAALDCFDVMSPAWAAAGVQGTCGRRALDEGDDCGPTDRVSSVGSGQGGPRCDRLVQRPGPHRAAAAVRSAATVRCAAPARFHLARLVGRVASFAADPSPAPRTGGSTFERDAEIAGTRSTPCRQPGAPPRRPRSRAYLRRRRPLLRTPRRPPHPRDASSVFVWHHWRTYSAHRHRAG